ncbi:uncharacterized protein N7459_003549 [Penicillium hispanicum]|uniref:uncharacterized protein n=1 Tax=Penicillium hispanicum TaxID=1080232 RepID=UPI00253F667A|nr:uncharacterized protein N7459_003549 [Penicillium hispanicum]KAJ5587784.1 hypothetical protein N7459_003549 [Penicillium hispanicum]
MGGKTPISSVPLSGTNSTNPKQPNPSDDPHRYTGGRWLHRDEVQRTSREVDFDFSALCDRVISLSPGATNVIKYEKREGGFNRVFILTMDTGSCVVARIPMPIAGPPRLTTNSEVATMTYLQSKLSLPIPKVLDWDDNPSNPTGTEYIIQEHVVGVQLHEIWPKMDSPRHMMCTKALSMAIKKMGSLDFPAYGSLYFSDAPIDSHLKIPLERDFCIGPHCGPVFWNRSPGEPQLYGGPSPNCGPYTGFSRLPKAEDVIHHKLLPHQGSIQEHIHLIQSSQEVMHKLVEDQRTQDAAKPTLLHPDFHKRNIYVSAEDPTHITGLIDWQSTSIEPAFLYTNETPDFAVLPEEPEEDTFQDEAAEQQQQDPSQKQRELKDASICAQTYDGCRARAHSLTDKELEAHGRDYEDFETFQRLKRWLRWSLQTNSDGWVPNELWDAAREAHRAAYQEWIQTARESEARGEDLTVAKADKLWPFDAR